MALKGIGGIFIKSKDPQALYQWYQDHFDIIRIDDGSLLMPVEQENPGYMRLRFLAQETDYFSPTRTQSIFNMQVKDLDEVLKKLSSKGVKSEKQIEKNKYGRFAWVYDPEGNRIELWQSSPYLESLVRIPEAE